MPLRVGLTGGIASGKSTVCATFAKMGATIIDADDIVRAICQPGEPAYQQIIAHFGNKVVLDNGQLNRQTLRDIIFNDNAARQALEAIIHPLVRQQLAIQLQKNSAAFTLVAVPLLIEANMQDLFDRILLVTVNRATQLKRLLSRDKISRGLAERMIAAQIDDQQRLHYADDIIDNNGDVELLTCQIAKLMKNYQQLAANNP